MDSGIIYHHTQGHGYMFSVSRHLAWDMGHGFKIAELYKTGWFVVALSVVTALGIASL